MVDLYVKTVPQRDPRLGRQVVHDPASRGFAMRATVDTSTWRTRSIRIYDPAPNPNQVIGNCTGCAKAMQLNALGNRKRGVVLNMNDATTIYSRATTLDPWEGAYPPIDTGSSGLASCLSARAFGFGGDFRWFFGGIDEIVTYLMTPDAIPVSIGTWWYDGLFNPNSRGVVEPTGPKVGGHQYIARGFNASADRVKIRCWWGDYRDVEIDRSQLGELIADDGDCHTQVRA